MLDTIIGIFLFLVLLAFHECGHLISAKVFGLQINNIGIAWTPVIHPYIEVRNVPDNYVKYIFLYAGPFVTLILFLVCVYNEWIQYSPLYYAFMSLIASEYNPYHSDFTISGIFNKSILDKYARNNLWYVWFMAWIAFVIFCFAPGGLKLILHLK